MKNRRLRRSGWIIPAVVIFAGGIPGCSRAEPLPEVVRPVRAMQAGDTEMLTRSGLPGRAKATQEVNLAFRVAGPLISRPINVGDDVAEGDVLAQIDPRDFDVALRNTEAQLEDARAAFALATEEFSRATEAHERGGVSEIELARRREASNSRKARVDGLEASVQAARDALDDTQLRAPYDGKIVAIYVENFEEVQAKQAITRVLDDSRIEMIIDLPEQFITLASIVGELICTFDAVPGHELVATVKEIGAEASQTTRTYPVTLIMDQPEGVKVFPGMTGRARPRAPVRAEAGEGIEVPATAIASTTARRVTSG